MARGDGYHYHFIMNVTVHLPLDEPLFHERHNNARGDGFVSRRIVAFLQTNNNNNTDRLEESNQAEMPTPVTEQDARNENPFPLVEPDVPLEPLDQRDDFLLYDYESEASESQDSGFDYSDLEFSDLEEDDDEDKEDSHEEIEVMENSGA